MGKSVSVSFYTFGCRLNQAETASLCDAFERRGYIIQPFGEQADVCVLNTCSVTGHSEARCRNMIRHVLRKHPATFLIVIGCYAQVGLDALRRLEGIDLIVGTAQKFALPAYLDALAAANDNILAKQAAPLVLHTAVIDAADFTMPAVGNFMARTRANLKIQDGCNFFCAYCIVPYTRGRDRSREFEDIRQEALALVARGYREIVVTGVNIGMYQHAGKGLLDVLQMLEALAGLQRIRLTSIEPMTVPAGFIEYLTGSTKLCRFLHIPLQSGDNTILQRMNRRYTRDAFAAFVTSLAAAIPDVNLGTDLIVGFPGEGDAEFEHSRAVLAELPLNYAHVFSFSPRQGTPAANLPERVPAAIIKQRSETLRALSHQKRRDFHQRYIGQTVSVLFEGREKQGLWTGYTANYIKVGVTSPQPLTNRFGTVRLTALTDANLALGELLAMAAAPDQKM